ncbi:MAG: UPF0280 family protein [Thermodesulfobacteriota bacterium]
MNETIVFQSRDYRDFDQSGGFKAFRVAVETSDLYVKALVSLERETEALIRECRSQIEWAISRRPEFLTSLVPVEEDPADPPPAARMVRAGRKAGTGPMAAVAGEVADYVGRGLLKWSKELIVENGGDLFIQVERPVMVGLYAGSSPFTGRVGVRIQPTVIPLGVCTSSGTVGPSLSQGKADAATVISHDVALADAVATALGNRIVRPSDLKPALKWALDISGVMAAAAILGDTIAAQGDIELGPIA